MKKYNSFLGAFFSGDNGQGGYNAAYRKGALASLYNGQLAPEQQNEVAANLSRVDPEAANKWQNDIVKQSATLLVTLGKDNPLAVHAWQTRIKPNLSRIYGAQADALPDVPDDNAFAIARQIASAGGEGDPGAVREFKYMTDGLTPQDREKARRIALGLDPRPSSAAIAYKEITGADGRKRLVAVDPRTPGAIIIDGSQGFGGSYGAEPDPEQPQPPAGRGGIVFPEDVAGAAQRTSDVMQQVKTEIAQLVAQGVSVADATSQVTQKYARMRGLTMPSQGQAPAATPRPVVSQRQANPGAFVSMSPAEEEAAKAEAKARVELEYAAQVEAAKAKAKAEIEAQTAPGIEGAKAEQTAAGKARGERAAAGEKKASEASEAINLIRQAEELLTSATGGFFGAKADEFAAAFGKSTKGAEANAQLNVIAPKLVGLVPRFEGPQSDADRQLYQQAAGDLGNPNKPVSIRLAAAKTMMRLYMQAEQQNSRKNDGQQKRIRITL